MRPELLVLVTLIGALLLFAGLLQLGVGIVRWLRLPTDLPEGPRFEPPPPTPHEDASGAPARAADRAAWAAQGQRARALWQAAIAAHEAQHPNAAALEAAARAGEAAFRARDEAALVAAEQALAAAKG